MLRRVVEAAWAPDGTRLAVTLMSSGIGLDVVVVGAASNGGPVWSPDGTRIAFHVDADPPVVRIIAADGSGAQDVYTGGESPVWVKSWQPLP